MTRLSRLLGSAWTFAVASIASGAPAAGPNASGAATVELSAGRIRLADVVVATIRVDVAAGQRVRWPDLGDRLGSFRITRTVDEPAHAARGSAGPLTVTRVLTLEPTITGLLEIPRLTIAIEGRAGEPAMVLETTPSPVTVDSLLAPGVAATLHPADSASELSPIDRAALGLNQLRDAYTPPTADGGLSRGRWAVIALATVIALGGVGWAVRRRRSRGFEILDQLDARLVRLGTTPAAAADARQMCDVLAASLRAAIADRARSEATAWTVEQFRSWCGTQPTLDADLTRRICDDMGCYDLERFDDHANIATDWPQRVERARSFIAHLRGFVPSPPPPGEAEDRLAVGVAMGGSRP